MTARHWSTSLETWRTSRPKPSKQGIWVKSSITTEQLCRELESKGMTRTSDEKKKSFYYLWLLVLTDQTSTLQFFPNYQIQNVETSPLRRRVSQRTFRVFYRIIVGTSECLCVEDFGKRISQTPRIAMLWSGPFSQKTRSQGNNQRFRPDFWIKDWSETSSSGSQQCERVWCR